MISPFGRARAILEKCDQDEHLAIQAVYDRQRSDTKNDDELDFYLSLAHEEFGEQSHLIAALCKWVRLGNPSKGEYESEHSLPTVSSAESVTQPQRTLLSIVKKLLGF